MNPLLEEQPMPVIGNNSESVWPDMQIEYEAIFKAHPELKALLADRVAQGIAKYGTTLRTHDGRDTKKDCLQELADAPQYSHKEVMEARRRGDNATVERWTLVTRNILVALANVHGDLAPPLKKPLPQTRREKAEEGKKP